MYLEPVQVYLKSVQVYLKSVQVQLGLACAMDYPSADTCLGLARRGSLLSPSRIYYSLQSKLYSLQSTATLQNTGPQAR